MSHGSNCKRRRKTGSVSMKKKRKDHNISGDKDVLLVDYASRGDYCAVQTLLAQKANPLVEDHQGWNCLFWAHGCDNKDRIKCVPVVRLIARAIMRIQGHNNLKFYDRPKVSTLTHLLRVCTCSCSLVDIEPPARRRDFPPAMHG